MHADMTVVMIQSNKIVSNEVKDNSALLEPSRKKKLNELYGQPSISVRTEVYYQQVFLESFGSGK